MARKKPDPKPLFSVKHDFVDSLDNFIQKVVMLRNAAHTLCDIGGLPDKAKQILSEQVAELDKAMMSNE